MLAICSGAQGFMSGCQVNSPFSFINCTLIIKARGKIKHSGEKIASLSTLFCLCEYTNIDQNVAQKFPDAESCRANITHCHMSPRQGITDAQEREN